jgi:hypothetical protein
MEDSAKELEVKKRMGETNYTRLAEMHGKHLNNSPFAVFDDKEMEEFCDLCEQHLAIEYELRAEQEGKKGTTLNSDFIKNIKLKDGMAAESGDRMI